MSRIPKIVALLAGLAAAACQDSFAQPSPPLDSFYYPVGVAVRPLPGGKSALLVASTNFDLRYDQVTGGTILAVDPEASTPVAPDGTGGVLAVLGAVNVGTFGGELAWADAVDTGTAWRAPGTYCPELASDPVLAAGGAKVLVGSRSLRTLYRVDMDATGALSHAQDWETQLPQALLDPYGVTIVCSSRSGTPVADAYFTHLQSANGLGWVSRLDLRTGAVVALGLGYDLTYTTAYDPDKDWLFVSTRFGAGTAPIRWFQPLMPASTVEGSEGFAFPAFRQVSVNSIVRGGLTRDQALSNDRRLLFVALELFDYDQFAATGAIYTQAGALAIFDLDPDAFNQPRMSLVGLVPTCLGSGQVRVLPTRPGKRDLVAVTCDVEGSLALYDHEIGKVVRYVSLDTTTGAPQLGRMPFGLAVEAVDGARAAGPASPCLPGRPCDRIYVGAFYANLVNILELDPDDPTGAELVKRIGGFP